MSDKQLEIARRVEQFAHYLRLMDGRTHDEAEGSCFLIFDLSPEVDDSAGSADLRFTQFSFEENWFCIDLPVQTLKRCEAEQILRRRIGFFFLRDRQQFTLHGEQTAGSDPFRKVYLYGDEWSAAEDMAFVLFEVWRFPVDVRLYVTAAAFGDGRPDWEQRLSIQ
jgi:hypothetical protein